MKNNSYILALVLSSGVCVMNSRLCRKYNQQGTEEHPRATNKKTICNIQKVCVCV